ncbi:ERCC4 domain-containing protein [Cercophora newfieldiana]|uniref:Crossover junction endonuclease MUS81 n=1 Tax=Cercophora newfieldiana TaxID=92897 RepID=A0AA39YSW3_9PEZI|nr:ERCC4 domain-containing protein [Cercophora newfieldiana]
MLLVAATPKLHDTCANPQFLQWVKEFWDKERERNTKGVTTYRHAYDALKACPIAFQHPSELQKLKGFGPKICARLTDKLKAYCEENGLPMPHPSRKRGGRAAQTTAAMNPWFEEGADGEDGEAPRPAKKPRKTKPYVPTYRSGAYALVLALSLQDENDTVGLTKTALIDAAQPYCEASFTAPPDPTSYYTAWNSIKTLEGKELVYERGRPLKRYCLTDEGWEVAKRIRELALSKGDVVGAIGSYRRMEDVPLSQAPLASQAGPSRAPAVPKPRAPRQRAEQSPFVGDSEDDDEDQGENDGGSGSYGDNNMADVEPPQPQFAGSQFKNVVPDGGTANDDATPPHFTPIRLAPGSFTVEMILDTREVRAKTDRDYIQDELAKRGCQPTMRSLELGDVLWVARCNKPGWLSRMGSDGDEVVLDWIVERKRLDDLIGSIKDGRFHEQKFRLRRSGIKNVIYLVEEISMDPQHLQKYEESIKSAIAGIQVVNGYFLKRTQKIDESIRYLASMTKMLKKVYEGKPLHVIPTNVLTAKNYLPLINDLREKQPTIGHYISYPAFASLASKSDLMTLRDLYLKMLMCTRGVTGEKAIEIQKVWKTPRDFIKAFEQCTEPGEAGKKQREALVVNRLGHLVGRKKIVKGVSQKIAEVWGEIQGPSSE